MKNDLKSMDLDSLFSEMQAAAIKAHQVYDSGVDIKFQHSAVDALNAICEEIEARGPEASLRYLPLLKAAEPAVRLQAALVARESVPEIAVPILEDLSSGKYGGTIGVNAQMTLNGMRKRGLIAPKN